MASDSTWNGGRENDAGAADAPATRPAIPESLKRNWGWMLALGVAMVLGGLLAFVAPFAASIAVEAMVGAAMAVGGVIQALHAVRCAGWKGRAANGLSALLYLAGAALILLNPLAGLVALTLIAISVIGADGVVRVVIGAQMRPAQGWGWLVASGVVSVLVAGILFWLFPAVSLSLLGLLFGVSLLLEGTAFVAAAIALRRAAG